MASSSNYHIPALAAMAGIAIAASGYALSSSSAESRRRRKRIRSKILKERDAKYITGLINTGNSCFINSVLQALATLASLRSYLAERVDERGDELDTLELSSNDYVLQSVAYALYTTIEQLNKPLSRPRSMAPTDLLDALERKTNGTINREQQDAQELFQIISHALSSEEEIQYREEPSSLLDAGTLRKMTGEHDSGCASPVALDNLETASVSSVGTMGSMWSSFSVSSVGGHLRHRPRRPRNPFTGLSATKISCMKCGYTAPIRHNTFDNISLTIPQTLSCTLQNCIDTYTKVDMLTDFRCRKCMLLATLEALQQEQSKMASSSEEEKAEHAGKIQVLKDALRYNVEAPLPGIPLVNPTTTSCTTKQTMFANPPKSLCFHLSRSVYHPSGIVQKNHCTVRFPEYLDMAPYTTNGFLNTADPTQSLSSPPAPISPQARTSRTSLVYLRNMAAGNRFVHGRDGLNVALGSSKDNSDLVQNALPSLSLPAVRSIPYRLNAVIVHYGGHESGHFITYRRKKLPTGHDVRKPFTNDDHHSPVQETSTFWRCSDDAIDEVDIDTVLSCEAYMLFYERDV
ncbi:cysteine proteinase [Lichtheimia hyalospora FSU 10163]|nr:cysteine proteinase [Lichtheimia hyalospora FSU 10163]